jgi:citronellol/citronellal dehydrogenase
MGDSIAPADIEPMEAMVEAILLLARGSAELTGGTYVSLDLLEEQAVKVMGLDGEALA